MRFISTLLIIIVMTNISPVFANGELSADGLLNPDFGSHLGTIMTLNESDEAGIFVYNNSAELVISMQYDELRAASFHHLGAYLSVYDDSGQSLFELPNGSYQMQLTTSNGPINFTYRGQSGRIQGTESLTMEDDVLLQHSEDGLFQLYLLTTGEFSIVIGPDSDNTTYVLTFTGVDALNLKQEIHSE